MTSRLGISLSLVFAALLLPGSQAPAKEFQSRSGDAQALHKVTLTGEVVEVWCYVSETMGPGRGAKHMSCAAKCAVGGVPVGILDEASGQLYVAAKSNEPYTGCTRLLLPYLGKRVTASGFAARKAGCSVVRIERVQPAPPQKFKLPE